MHPLVEQATKKAAVIWLAVPGQHRAYPLWCLWIDGALYVVTGPGEQAAPGLAGATHAEVSVRGDHGGRIVTWPATVTLIDPAGQDWAVVAPQLVGKRLNAPDNTETTLTRWAAQCLVHRLTPAGDPI